LGALGPASWDQWYFSSKNHFSFYVVLVFQNIFILVFFYSSHAIIFVFILFSSQNILVLVHHQTAVKSLYQFCSARLFLHKSVTLTPSLEFCFSRTDGGGAKTVTVAKGFFQHSPIEF